MQLFKDLYNSFKTNDLGFSARKLSAFVAIAVAGVTTIRHSDSDNLFVIVCAWLTFCLLALGLVTASQLIQLKTGSTYTKTESTVTESVEQKKDVSGSGQV